MKIVLTLTLKSDPLNKFFLVQNLCLNLIVVFTNYQASKHWYIFNIRPFVIVAS